MTEISQQDMATKLLSENFTRSGPIAEVLSDPVTDTPMVVTLDELQPYELDPRITRNPRYDEIKESIRERGLDAPPPITRRPGADHYIIRNGGNTRLAILRELWSETKDERFFRIICTFRPWPERGEIVALTGHLAENELHGGLSFIERALGVAKARELYEQEDGKPLSQSELARRLKADGYPVPQPHISRMQEAIQYLLPAIPNVLYGGLGRPQIEQLTGLRRAGMRVWEARAANANRDMDFGDVFLDVLASFDANIHDFIIQRVQDELIGQMADLLGVKYGTIEFELTDSEKRWQLLSGEAESEQTSGGEIRPPIVSQMPSSSSPTSELHPPSFTGLPTGEPEPQPSPAKRLSEEEPNEDQDETPTPGHTISSEPSSDRLQTIQRLVATQLGETQPDIESDLLSSIAAQAGSLYPVSDIWHIEPGLDAPERLRIHIAQFAREIADEAGLSEQIVSCVGGIGFMCVRGGNRNDDQSKAPFPRAILALLHVLSAPYHRSSEPIARIETLHMASDIGALLLGPGREHASESLRAMRLSDDGLVKLFRLIRLARRLLELEGSELDGDSATPQS